jgi:CheY-like chemotaxis protein
MPQFFTASDTTVGMDRILLADDSPHAQRMGERILRDEGYEVVSVTDGETALLRLADVRPSLIVADVFLPGRSGLDICRYVRSHADYRHVRIILTAGMLESFDEEEARAAGADAIIKKPFEASMVLETVKPLIEAAREDSSALPAEADAAATLPEPAPPAVPEEPEAATVKAAPEPKAPPEPRLPAAVPVEMPIPAPLAASSPMAPPRLAPEPGPEPVLSGTGVSEEELLRAAVTVALDAAFPALVEDITARVLRNLRVAVGGPVAPDTDPPADVPVPVAPLTTD